jgi:hypothetical protein
LLEEDFILDVTPAVEGTINTIKDLLLNSDAKFSGKIATLYDEWCDGFESIAEAPVAKEEVKKEKEEAKAQ